MTEDELLEFWGDLARPTIKLLGRLFLSGDHEAVELIRQILTRAEKAALEEREACAKVCETYNTRQSYNDEDMAVANECALAIRERGQE